MDGDGDAASPVPATGEPPPSLHVDTPTTTQDGYSSYVSGDDVPMVGNNGRFGGVPASGEAIAALPETTYGGQERGELRDDEEECAVCWEGYEPGDALRTMPCSHAFHERCIFRWLRLSRLCPLCRFALPAEVAAETDTEEENDDDDEDDSESDSDDEDDSESDEDSDSDDDDSDSQDDDDSYSDSDSDSDVNDYLDSESDINDDFDWYFDDYADVEEDLTRIVVDRHQR